MGAAVIAGESLRRRQINCSVPSQRTALEPTQPKPGNSPYTNAASRAAKQVEEDLRLHESPDTDPRFRDDALCAQTDPEAFFPEKGGSTREAKRICGRCDVRGDCLAYALARDERFGIWGGLSERERRRLKRRAG